MQWVQRFNEHPRIKLILKGISFVGSMIVLFVYFQQQKSTSFDFYLYIIGFSLLIFGLFSQFLYLRTSKIANQGLFFIQIKRFSNLFQTILWVIKKI